MRSIALMFVCVAFAGCIGAAEEDGSGDPIAGENNQPGGPPPASPPREPAPPQGPDPGEPAPPTHEPLRQPVRFESYLDAPEPTAWDTGHCGGISSPPHVLTEGITWVRFDLEEDYGGWNYYLDGSDLIADFIPRDGYSAQPWTVPNGANAVFVCMKDGTPRPFMLTLFPPGSIILSNRLMVPSPGIPPDQQGWNTCGSIGPAWTTLWHDALTDHYPLRVDVTGWTYMFNVPSMHAEFSDAGSYIVTQGWRGTIAEGASDVTVCTRQLVDVQYMLIISPPGMSPALPLA